LNYTPSEGISPAESSQPRAIPVSHNQYPLAQQPFYLLTPNPTTHEFYSAQSIVTHSIPVSLAPAGVQQHVQLVQQQFDSAHPVTGWLEIHMASQAGISPVDGNALGTVPQAFSYEHRTCLLNEPDGTDWASLRG
jgi:hypothetical protein